MSLCALSGRQGEALAQYERLRETLSRELATEPSTTSRALIPFDTEEVVKQANGTVLGLASYFFTRDVERVMRLGEHLEYGFIGAKEGMPSVAQAPFGGLEESDFGRERGRCGIGEYLDIKYVSLGGTSG